MPVFFLNHPAVTQEKGGFVVRSIKNEGNCPVSILYLA